MNILLITAFFYPQNVIAVSRVGQWAKYWSRAGHNVTILTTKKHPFWPLNYQGDLPKSVNVVEVDFIKPWMERILFKSGAAPISRKSEVVGREGAGKLKFQVVDFAKKIIKNRFDPHDMWVRPATKAGLSIMNSENFDLIVSSFSPSASHKIAANLKRVNSGVHWIADFRDLWSRNHMVDRGWISSWLAFQRESRVMRYADAITTVSDPLKEIIAKDYPGKLVRTIENGFDPDEHPGWGTSAVEPRSASRTLLIRYTGLVYPGKQDPTPLFLAVNNLLDAGKINKESVSIEFYGNNNNAVQKIINDGNFDRHRVIRVFDSVARDVSLNLQKNSDLLLFLEWGDPSAQGVLTGKLFEYMVSGRPILAIGIGRESAAAELIKDAGIGVLASDVGHIEEILLSYMEDGAVAGYHPDVSCISYYSRERQAARLLNIVSELEYEQPISE